MSQEQIGKLRRRYALCRTNLFMMAGLTALNLVLIGIGSDTSFLFAAAIPQVVLWAGMDLAVEFGSAFLIAAIVIDVIALGIYLLCAFKAKTSLGAVRTALVLFMLDTALMLYLAVTSGAIISFALNILFSVWVLVYLFLGSSAGKKLKAEDIPFFAPAGEAVQPAAPRDGAVYGDAEAPEALSPRVGDSLSVCSVQGGVPLLTANYRGLFIRFLNRPSRMQLAVGDEVYAEKTGLFPKSCDLEAVVCGVSILLQYRVSVFKTTFTLTADGVQIAQGSKLT